MARHQAAKKKSKFQQTFNQVSRYSAVGLELGFSVAIGAGAGYYLDGYFDTSPWLTIFLLLCGVASGFKRIYMVLKSLEREQEEMEREEDTEPTGQKPVNIDEKS